MTGEVAARGWEAGPCFYVSMVDGGRHWLLAGPFPSHEDALARVDDARAEAERVDPMTCFYSFGTCKAPDGSREGRLNGRLGIGDRPGSCPGKTGVIA